MKEQIFIEIPVFTECKKNDHSLRYLNLKLRGEKSASRNEGNPYTWPNSDGNHIHACRISKLSKFIFFRDKCLEMHSPAI